MKSINYSILALSMVAGSSTAAYAADSNQSAGWDFSLAIGSVSAPAYLGADTQQLSAVPSFNINYADRFFASIGTGAGLTSSMLMVGERVPLPSTTSVDWKMERIHYSSVVMRQPS